MKYKSDILEENWVLFIRFLAGFRDKTTRPYDPVEQDFWEWYLETKLKVMHG